MTPANRATPCPEASAAIGSAMAMVAITVAIETLREPGRRLMLVLSMAVILRSNPDGCAIASATGGGRARL